MTCHLLNLPSDPETLDQIRTISGVVGVLAAIAAGIFAASAWRRERRRDELRDLERRAAQAEQVAAWLEELLQLPQVASDSGTQGGQTSSVWMAYVRNRSGLPVYDAELHWSLWIQQVSDDDFETFTLKLATLPPSDEPHAFRTSEPLVIKYETLRAAIPRDGSEPKRPEIRLELRFRDSRGQRWVREFDGRLYWIGPRGTLRPAS